MEKVLCISCYKPKATLECGICHSAVCKYCARFIDEETFAFLDKIPAELSHTTYCHPCFEEKVAPALAEYNDTMERAKQVGVFFKKQSKETKFIKRLEEPVVIENCADRNETILRLAFHAAKLNLNSILDVDVSSEKVKTGSYQTQKWRGTAVPAHVNPDKLIKDRSFSDTPN